MYELESGLLCFTLLLNSIAEKFPYLVTKKLKEGQEVRRVAQLDWRIIEENCETPFVASGLQFVPLPVTITKPFLVVPELSYSLFYIQVCY